QRPPPRYPPPGPAIDPAPVAGRSLLIRPRLVVRESTAPAPVPAPAGASVPASTEAGQPLVG
ncbi:hypothetical protein ACFV5K_39635, partial [Streptomyces sp. NPDC059744]